MNLITSFLYYSFFASVILFNGIGTNKILDLQFEKIRSLTYCTKVIISIMLSSIIGYLITKGVLVPLKIAELFPLVCFLIYICIDAFLEALIRLTTGKSAAEFIFSYLVIILSISEGFNILNVVIINLSCLASFVCILPFIMSFKKRNSDTKPDILFCRLFLYLALLILALSVWDVAWLNPEAFL